MSDKENYFPPNTSIEQINDTMYTDHGFLTTPNDTESNEVLLTDKEQAQAKALLNPPF